MLNSPENTETFEGLSDKESSLLAKTFNLNDQLGLKTDNACELLLTIIKNPALMREINLSVSELQSLVKDCLLYRIRNIYDHLKMMIRADLKSNSKIDLEINPEI